MKKKRTLAQKINILRAAVMGANDGILSVAGIVVGVAGASTDNFAIFISGIAGMLAGSISMAMGEYVSVHAQKDAQKKAIMEQEVALKNNYQHEFDFVKEKYLARRIAPELAHKATYEMMTKDSVRTTIRERFGFDVQNVINPYDAAFASLISFPIGSILPLASISLSNPSDRVVITFIAVIIALAITGYSAAILSKANRWRGVLRNVISGILTMVVTYTIGTLIGG